MRRLASTLERRAWAEGLAGTEGLADIFLGWIRGLVRREEDFQAQIRDLVPALDGAIPGMRRVGELRGRVLALSYFAVKVRYEGDPDEATAREALDTARAVYDLAAKLIHEREG
jgi:hypothetical protein